MRDDSELIVTDVASPLPEVSEVDLYQRRERIYTRRVKGFFQRIRLYTGWPLLLGYFLLPWLNWGDRQAVLFDLPERKFHIFFITFWPQDFPLLAWTLIISAFALFAVTNFAGRVWCGYTCPQTVWTSIFMWVEQLTEGTPNQRRKLDDGPLTREKLFRKSAKHLMWIGFSFLTGFTFVGYFTPVRELALDLPLGDAGFWAYAWTLFFTCATYINAGWMREQVCMYMCPYARFQSVMFDPDTLIVSYDPRVGEPRGARRRDVDPAQAGLGNCIDCKLCVQVCPTGIDIRNGLQYECIGCALCIDACNSVMDQMGYPRTLIRYTTERELAGGTSQLLRPRLVGYFVVLTLMIALAGGYLLLRKPLEVDVIRDRNTLYTLTGAGLVENVYTVKILNMSELEHRYRLDVFGLEQFEVVGDTEITVPAGEVLSVPIRLRADPAYIDTLSQEIEFRVTPLDSYTGYQSSENRFISPDVPF